MLLLIIFFVDKTFDYISEEKKFNINDITETIREFSSQNYDAKYICEQIYSNKTDNINNIIKENTHNI